MIYAGFHWAAIPSSVLNIPASLLSGQVFRWRRTTEGEWRGVIGETVVRLRPERDGFWWQTCPVEGQWEILRRYFALDVDLTRLYADWAAAEPRIAPALERFAGLRILRQDAEEAFFAFLCASCNTIAKITRSVMALARRYGEPLAEIEGETFYRFPTAERLAGASEVALRADLWGYRAPRVIELARHALLQGGDWHERLRALPYRPAHAELTRLPGIGAKIADCLCLFALWKDEACPVDTHIRQIAVRLFRPDLAGRALTPGVYRAIAEAYRERFGPYAGWAQQYLFFAALPRSESLLSAEAAEERRER
jgi:N-glycosylase/DNA lyase